MLLRKRLSEAINFLFQYILPNCMKNLYRVPVKVTSIYHVEVVAEDESEAMSEAIERRRQSDFHDEDEEAVEEDIELIEENYNDEPLPDAADAEQS